MALIKMVQNILSDCLRISQISIAGSDIILHYRQTLPCNQSVVVSIMAQPGIAKVRRQLACQRSDNPLGPADFQTFAGILTDDSEAIARRLKSPMVVSVILNGKIWILG